MHKRIHTHIRTALGASTFVLGLTTLFLVAVATETIAVPKSVEGILLPAAQRGVIPWKTLEREQVAYGYTVPKNTHVIFKLPKSFIRISRNTLFGETGPDVRYWGYCFPDSIEQTGLSGLAGTFFMSELEEKVVLEEERKRIREAVYRRGQLTTSNLNLQVTNQRRVRNQKDEFRPGEVCYIMAQEPIPIGLDPDNDLANNRVERTYRTDPNNRDTDGDFVLDGIEIHRLKTQPLIRDTDADGLIDGIEDKNRNGVLDFGETSPINNDSDADGLCDGICRSTDNNGGFSGEDLNINGLVDENETDPTKKDTDEDGIYDEQEYYLCQLKGEVGGNCN